MLVLLSKLRLRFTEGWWRALHTRSIHPNTGQGSTERWGKKCKKKTKREGQRHTQRERERENGLACKGVQVKQNRTALATLNGEGREQSTVAGRTVMLQNVTEVKRGGDPPPPPKGCLALGSPCI